MACPLATLYSSPTLDVLALSVLMLDDIFEGSTVSCGGVTIDLYITSHPDSLSRGATFEIPSGASALVSKSMFKLGRRTLINLSSNPPSGLG